MAYYTALINHWPSVTGATTAIKLANLNAETAAGAAIPMVVPTYRIYNLIDLAEFTTLTAANQQLVRDILGMGTVDGSPGTSIRNRMLAIFTVGASPITRAALVALAALYDTPTVPWWQANGYPRPFDLGDIAAAGLS